MYSINTKLLLRLLNSQEFFAHQWLMSYPNDHQTLSELINIRSRQFSIRNSSLKTDLDERGSGSSSGSGRGTIKGLRAKNDPNVNPAIKSRRLTR